MVELQILEERKRRLTIRIEMSDLFDCKTNEFDCLNSNYVYDVIIIMIID